MRINTRSILLLLVLAAALPLVVAARPPATRDVPVVLETGVVEVSDEATPFAALFTAPEGATWVTIRNDSPHMMLLGTDRAMTIGNSWTLTAGEEITFSLESPVHLRAVTGQVRMRVLAGR